MWSVLERRQHSQEYWYHIGWRSSLYTSIYITAFGPRPSLKLTDWNGILDDGGDAVTRRIRGCHRELKHLTHCLLVVLRKCKRCRRDVTGPVELKYYGITWLCNHRCSNSITGKLKLRPSNTTIYCIAENCQERNFCELVENKFC